MSEAKLATASGRAVWYFESVLIPWLRSTHGIHSQNAAAKAAGFSSSAVSGWRRGDNDPDQGSLDLMVRAAERPLAEAGWIKTGSGEKPHPVDLDGEDGPRPGPIGSRAWSLRALLEGVRDHAVSVRDAESAINAMVSAMATPALSGGRARGSRWHSGTASAA